ncbi:MAG: restriction endonuclease subunit S [Patescibacteria group bacterium]
MAMNKKEFLLKLGFLSKEGALGVLQKKFAKFNDYIIEVDFEEQKINFGSKIRSDSGTTQNFFQEENWVVLECVNRLLEKGYKPEDIILEKIFPTGHGTSGRLDILIEKNGQAYLMIECKTWGIEFEKESKKLKKDGGQIFTYFQQDRNAEYLIIYTSDFIDKKIEYKNEIVKIEDHYREAGNVKDLFERWSKLTKLNGIFDDWVNAYEYQSKALTTKDLKIIKQEDSSFIFNRFLEILRQNVVSDKPNAFNKIFTLFLCKIVDENRSDNEQLHFQWLDGEDDNISFQKRLTDLYKKGMHELLEKEVTDVSDQEFEQKFGAVDSKYKADFLKILTEIRLKKNNEFAFKEVFDDASFEDNAKVVKEVVELLQGFKIRYNQKHQYLGDFFELLLTTGLKQESGQFFTPVPVARFIVRSLPIKEIIDEKLKLGNPTDLLPFTIDYAAGSGHFLTESMDEIQKNINVIDENILNPQSAKKIKSWKSDQFNWAFDYLYGIEKDYRLVKTAKVGCYLHGDGLAKVIHEDGLNTFDKPNKYRGKLKETDSNFHQDNKQFDLVISNPPYSVSAFKGTLNEECARESFDLFSKLTDQSSEIECLFIERTKQLLKDGGMAGIILPSSILSNAGIYTKAREILFKYFEIISITELGSGTFMATGTNTVVLFLRRRTNYEWENFQESVNKFFHNFNDVTVNGIENVFSRYVKFVWEKLDFSDYITFCQGKPNDRIKKHVLYKEYLEKIKIKNEKEIQDIIIRKEKEKILYFILSCSQKVVIVKSGDKKEEKLFLGYEFSFRRGYEGIHPIQRNKSIDECTKMFDPSDQKNRQKASSYIYQAFLGDDSSSIDDTVKNHVFRANLVDMMSFDRIDFEKTISLSFKKKIKFESLWKTDKFYLLSDIADIKKGTSITQEGVTAGDIPVIAGGQTPAYFHNKANRDGNIITVSASGAYAGFVNYFRKPIFASDCNTIKSKDENSIKTKLLYEFLKNTQNEIYTLQRGQAQPHVYSDDLSKIKIPMISNSTQNKILEEIEKINKSDEQIVGKIKALKEKIKKHLFSSNKFKNVRIGDILTLEYGSALPERERINGKYPVMGSNGVVGRHNSFIVTGPTIIVGRKGSAGKVNWIDEDNYPIDTTFYVKKNSEDVDYKFLYYVLASLELEDLILGAGVPGLNRNDVYNQTCNLPSLVDQKKAIDQIVKIEDEIVGLNQKLNETKQKKDMILNKYL